MSTTPQQHKQQAPSTVCCAVVTISDTRTLETDTGGGELIRLLAEAGHTVSVRTIIPDDPQRIRGTLNELRQDKALEVVLMTGGTGISSRDGTYETVSPMLTKPLPGYGELFRMLSYAEIGAAAMLSRTCGGLLDRLLVLTMPGSQNAVRLAMQKIILPELGHLVREARR